MLEKYNPKKELFQLYQRLDGSQLPMFIGVYLGLKPLMDTFIPMNSFLLLKEICAKEGILVEHNGYMAQVPSDDFLRKKERVRNLGTTKLIAIPFSSDRRDVLVHTFISRSADQVEEARRLTWYNLFVGDIQMCQLPVDNHRYGLTLGFPECCIAFYSVHNGKFHDGKRNWGWNTPFEVYKNTKGEFSFLCNHVPMDHGYFLIHHYPCTYNCPATIEKAGALLEGIRSIEPDYAEKIEYYLKLPYLLFEEKRAFIFEGRIEGNTIFYDDYRFLGDYRDQFDYTDILNGNKLTVTEENITIFRGNEILAEHPMKGNYLGKIYRFY